MKVLLDYDKATNTLTGPGCLNYIWTGLEEAEFKPGEHLQPTVELIKLGVSPNDIIKLKHQRLI